MKLGFREDLITEARFPIEVILGNPLQLRTCIAVIPIRQGRATTMASDPDPQRGHLVPIVASSAGIHSRAPLSAVSIDTKHAQSTNWRPHLVHSRLIRIRLLLDGLATLGLSPSRTIAEIMACAVPIHELPRAGLIGSSVSEKTSSRKLVNRGNCSP